MKKRNYFKTALCIIVPVCIVLLFFVIFFTLGYVNSESMQPTIKANTTVAVNKLAYVTREPQRGDVIAFNNGGEVVIKRIIGIPGETISFIDGHVFVDGNILEEDYLPNGAKSNSTETFTVPARYYFVLGDNRENSIDSRYFSSTYISEKNILGRVIYDFNGFPGKPIYQTTEILQETTSGVSSTGTDDTSGDKTESKTKAAPEETEE